MASCIARLYPQRLHGIHLNLVCPSFERPKSMAIALIGNYFPSLVFSQPVYQEEGLNFGARILNLIKESGYMHIQATKPDTVGTIQPPK